LQKLLEHILREWSVLKGAPASFIILVALSISAGLGIGAWHYSGRISEMETQVSTTNGEIHRYKVALGLEAASRGNLIELTNDELRVRALSTAAKLREVCTSLRERDEAAAKAEAKAVHKLDQKEKFLRGVARMKSASDEIDRTVRTDTALIDNELRRRLSPKAIATIVGLSPSMYDAATGSPIDILALVTSTGGGFSTSMCVLSNGIEQMAKILPSDGK
jgi:hypothetical protein